MPWCSVLWLGNGLECVGLYWGPWFLFCSGPGCRGFAMVVSVGCPGWCASVLVCSVRGLCL